MRHGIKYQLNGSTIQQEVQAAIKQFYQAEHTQGLTPIEVHFAPEQKPDDAMICGLRVLTDESGLVGPDFIRVTTEPMDFADELAADMHDFERQVAVVL